MSITELKELMPCVERGDPIPADAALEILRCSPSDLPHVMSMAWAVRCRFHGDSINLCSIVNARSGSCCEDCAFCAQSAHHDTAVDIYKLIPVSEMTAAYDNAAELPISHFGVVTSGPGQDDDNLSQIASLFDTPKSGGPAWCASLGKLSLDRLKEMKKSGLTRFHHNLETAASFFDQVCTTHSYADRLETIRAAREAGLEVCSGGILGLGESLEQRVEFAQALSEEMIDSIPLNFLVPIEGTPMADRAVLPPLDILRTVAMFRLTNPRAEIKVCSGRNHLRRLQSMIFYAGATGMMTGELLTIAGGDIREDLQMLEDLGLPVKTGH